MSKITNSGLGQDALYCIHMTTVGVKGLMCDCWVLQRLLWLPVYWLMMQFGVQSQQLVI